MDPIQSTTIDLIVDLYSNVVRRMDSVLEAYLGQDGGPLEPDDIPKTNNPVWILGKKYSAVQGNPNPSPKKINSFSFIRNVSHSTIDRK